MDNFFTEERVAILKELNDKYPNGMEFGYQVRVLFRMDQFILSIPNDLELSREIRKKIL